MNDTISIEQRAALGSESTQIATQNNYYGLTPKEACEMAIKLFYDNFPKLQEQAKELVEKRVTEFMDEVATKLYREKITDMSPLADPDVQYVVYEAQKNYARFANKDLLSILSDFIVERIKTDKDDYFKIILDKAISIVPNLTKEQIDTLTLLFYYKSVKFSGIHNLNDLKRHFDFSTSRFSICSEGGYSLLNTLGCLDLHLGDICEITSKVYSLKKEDVEKICPQNLKELHCDYAPSHVGIIIAIINSNNKTNYKFDWSIWIHT
ncbi:MAG: LPO_1073/Vpar_1526 family protein [Acutalibacteraceae bacterium]